MKAYTDFFVNLQRPSKEALLALLEQPVTWPQSIAPFTAYTRREHVDKDVGKAALQEQKVGCLILAGGQGSRLGWSGPKGTFPILGKSLFDWLLDRIPAGVPVAVLVSNQNVKQTKEFLAGREVTFIVQDDLPLLDDAGNFLQGLDGQTLEQAAGNGSALYHFVASGIAEQWERQGVQYITITPIDNPLANPCDPYLLGQLISTQADVALNCVERSSTEEKVGVLVDTERGPQVIEYTDMPSDQNDGRHRCGSTGLFALTLSFAKEVAAQAAGMPLHCVRKQVDEHGWVNKFERFLFELCLFTEEMTVMLSPRKMCFAPVKQTEDVPVIEALLNRC